MENTDPGASNLMVKMKLFVVTKTVIDVSDDYNDCSEAIFVYALELFAPSLPTRESFGYGNCDHTVLWP